MGQTQMQSLITLQSTILKSDLIIQLIPSEKQPLLIIIIEGWQVFRSLIKIETTELVGNLMLKVDAARAFCGLGYL